MDDVPSSEDDDAYT